MGERSGDVRITAHPPERRRRSTVLAAAGCTCCCCCCVHTLGSVAGAIWGARRRTAPLPETLTTETAIKEEQEHKAANALVIRSYWLAVAIVVLVTCVVVVLESPHERPEAQAGISALVVALGLPIGQLAASVLTLIYINVVAPPRKKECLARLGRITLYSFLGTIIGCIGTALTLGLMK